MKTHLTTIKSIALTAIACLAFISCSKEEDKTKEVTLLGEWQSYNLDVLNEFGTGVEERFATNEFIITFTEDEASFEFRDGYSGYSACQENFTSNWEYTDDKKTIIFKQANEEYGYQIYAAIEEDGTLMVEIGHNNWDTCDLWYCSKVN